MFDYKDSKAANAVRHVTIVPLYAISQLKYWKSRRLLWINGNGTNKRLKNMNTLSYKGYIGSVVFSEKDGVFFGKIEGINGTVNNECGIV